MDEREGLTMTTNRIEQETFVAAPIERVWAVLTEPAHIPGWFGDSAEVELKPGGAAVFGWEEHADDIHRRMLERVKAELGG